MAVRRRVNIHIDALQLDAVPPAARHRAAAVLRAELERRVLSSGPARGLSSSRHVDEVAGRPVLVGRQARPEALGRMVADGVWRAISGGGR